MKTLGLLLFAVTLVSAQAIRLPMPSASARPRSYNVKLVWSDMINPPGTTYNVYRASGLCKNGLYLVKIASAVTVTNYMDTFVRAGNYCYNTTAQLNGVESVPSNSVSITNKDFSSTK